MPIANPNAPTGKATTADELNTIHDMPCPLYQTAVDWEHKPERMVKGIDVLMWWCWFLWDVGEPEYFQDAFPELLETIHFEMSPEGTCCGSLTDAFCLAANKHQPGYYIYRTPWQWREMEMHRFIPADEQAYNFNDVHEWLAAGEPTFKDFIECKKV